MPDRPHISAVLITLNEQNHLPQLLDRLAWVDEIVVVDGGSTDATTTLARRAGCRVFERRFENFAHQRNFAQAQARGQWCLSIDADERPSARFAHEVLSRTCDTTCSAYRVTIRSRIFGREFRHGGTQDDAPIRLVRRGHGRWIGSVHERLAVTGRVGRIGSPLMHDTIPDLATFLAKMQRYAQLEAAGRVAAGIAPGRRPAAIAGITETFRRLIWKLGLLDGPEGWAFAALSGVAATVTQSAHRRLWSAASKRRHATGRIDAAEHPARARRDRFYSTLSPTGGGALTVSS